jgi:hypothetical protein
MPKSLKKILEKPIRESDVEKIKWLYSGITAIDEKAKKAALEKDLEFMNKRGKYMGPEEFTSVALSKKLKIPEKYQTELNRYHQMFTSTVAEMLKLNELKDTTIGKMLGLPDSKENIFELKKKDKVIGFVHFDEKHKTIDFIADLEDVPKKFKDKLK